MSSKIYGDTRSFSKAELRFLERLTKKRQRREEWIDADTAEKIGEFVFKTGVGLGLLVNRSGEVVNVVVGTRQRLYLPSLGRDRVDPGRLRRLRFCAFFPEMDSFFVLQKGLVEISFEEMERRATSTLPRNTSSGEGVTRTVRSSAHS